MGSLHGPHRPLKRGTGRRRDSEAMGEAADDEEEEDRPATSTDAVGKGHQT